MRIYRRRRGGEYGPTYRDDSPISFGGVTKLEWDSSDSNSNLLLVDFPTGGATDVPVMLLALTGSDYTYFNGTTQPTMAGEDVDGDSYLVSCVRIANATSVKSVLYSPAGRSVLTVPMVMRRLGKKNLY